MLYTTKSQARQRPLPDAENFGGEVSSWYLTSFKIRAARNVRMSRWQLSDQITAVSGVPERGRDDIGSWHYPRFAAVQQVVGY
jgi:hypothetical protein